jgi:hypothetical protein
MLVIERITEDEVEMLQDQFHLSLDGTPFQLINRQLESHRQMQ